MKISQIQTQPIEDEKMKIFIKLFLFFVLLSGFIYAGENEYNIKNIPDELKDNADAVIRIKSLNFEVKNSSYAVRKEKIAVTVFNKEGQKYGEKIVWYNNHIEVEEFEGKIFDAEGKEIRELDNDEIKDYSAFNGFSLYEETRIKAAGLYYDKYPYTVEFISEVSYDGYVSWSYMEIENIFRSCSAFNF